MLLYDLMVSVSVVQAITGFVSGGQTDIVFVSEDGQTDMLCSCTTDMFVSCGTDRQTDRHAICIRGLHGSRKLEPFWNWPLAFLPEPYLHFRFLSLHLSLYFFQREARSKTEPRVITMLNTFAPRWTTNFWNWCTGFLFQQALLHNKDKWYPINFITKNNLMVHLKMCWVPHSLAGVLVEPGQG